MRQASDPTVASILWGLIVAALLGTLLSIPCGYSIADMLPIFGAVTVILGSYFAARTLRENEVDRATNALDAARSSVRVAGICRLGIVAIDAPRYLEYVRRTLNAIVAEETNEQQVKRAAESVLQDLNAVPPS